VTPAGDRGGRIAPLLEVGRVTRPHGLRGEVVVDPSGLALDRFREAQERFRLEEEQGRFWLRYYDAWLPLAPRTVGDVLDLALEDLDALLDPLLVLAEKEKSLELLAEEMLRTRRRVNALEFVLIPNLIETVKFINLKLAEAERSDQTRLMRVKEIIRGEAR